MNLKTSVIILVSYVAILLLFYTYIFYVDTPEVHSSEVHSSDVHSSDVHSSEGDSSEVDSLPSSTYQNNCHGLTKWAIVMSCDNKITPSMLKFLNSTQDWCLLVIGTHSVLWSASMELNSSCLIYMSIAALRTLPYKLVSYASLKPHKLMNSFSWKNIGYLYAIANGARVIYDMEESNFPLPINGEYLPVEQEKKMFKSPLLPKMETTGILLDAIINNKFDVFLLRRQSFVECTVLFPG